MNVLGVIETAGNLALGIVDRILPKKLDPSERAEAVLKIQELIEKRDDGLISAQRDVIVAELAQGDNFTKRARPTIVYVGLFAVTFNHVFVPFVNRVMEWIILMKGELLEGFQGLTPVDLPAEFWYVWAGVCSVYAVGRTAEKKGVRNKIVSWITGGKEPR